MFDGVRNHSTFFSLHQNGPKPLSFTVKPTMVSALIPQWTAESAALYMPDLEVEKKPPNKSKTETSVTKTKKKVTLFNGHCVIVAAVGGASA